MRRSNPFDKFLTPEDHLHIQVMTYLRMQYKDAKVMHAPNEGKRSAFEKYKISKLGVSSGFPDLFIVQRNIKIGLELKVKGNPPTGNQLEWIEILSAAGIPSTVATGFDQAKAFIDQHLKHEYVKNGNR